MKRWFRVFIISVFALAAVSLVIMQLLQTRRTFSVNDNMFSVGVSTAMDEVIRQLGTDGMPVSTTSGGLTSFASLDSMIVDELLMAGIDLHPVVGLYDGTQGSFLYSSDPQREEMLEESPYRYSFRPAGVESSTPLFIILAFPRSLLTHIDSSLYLYMSVFLVVVIAVMFTFSLRALTNQRRLDMMKNEFISNMTHEIKTPISTISLACEMLQEGGIDDDVAARSNFVGIIADENQRMRLLVETILQSSKMASKTFSLSLAEVDVDNMVHKVAQSFKLPLSNRGGTLELHLEAQPATVLADEMHLTNALYNLVDNAIKYSPEYPHIIISTRREGNRFFLAVRDHGIGISRQDQRHVFEKFYRVSTGNVHNVKGFGIGLSYVAQVARLHQGSISVESELGVGSTFTLCLVC